MAPLRFCSVDDDVNPFARGRDLRVAVKSLDDLPRSLRYNPGLGITALVQINDAKDMLFGK